MKVCLFCTGQAPCVPQPRAKPGSADMFGVRVSCMVVGGCGCGCGCCDWTGWGVFGFPVPPHTNGAEACRRTPKISLGPLVLGCLVCINSLLRPTVPLDSQYTLSPNRTLQNRKHPTAQQVDGTNANIVSAVICTRKSAHNMG